jgi:hypothetical protein
MSGERYLLDTNAIVERAAILITEGRQLQKLPAVKTSGISAPTP